MGTLGADESPGKSVEWGDKSGAPGSLEAAEEAQEEVAGGAEEAKDREQKQSNDWSDHDAGGTREQELRAVCMGDADLRRIAETCPDCGPLLITHGCAAWSCRNGVNRALPIAQRLPPVLSRSFLHSFSHNTHACAIPGDRSLFTAEYMHRFKVAARFPESTLGSERQWQVPTCAVHCGDAGVGLGAVVAFLVFPSLPGSSCARTLAMRDACLSQNPASGQDSRTRSSGQGALYQPHAASRWRIRPKARSARLEAKRKSIRSRKHRKRRQ